MTPTGYHCARADGGFSNEYALAFDLGRECRLLIVPALFDEANRMRRLTLDVMRRLDGAGIDSFLPDLPGCNESLEALSEQDPDTWLQAMAAAATCFNATHCLGIRGGSLFVPQHLPGWVLAPTTGASQLRQMLRARIMAARELGLTETQESLLGRGRKDGLDLAGHRLGSRFIGDFQTLGPVSSAIISEISQDTLGGGGLWLRAEPDEDRTQADALAAILAIGMRA